MPLKIVAFLTPKAGAAADLEAAVRDLVAGSRSEPGNLRYDAWWDEEKGRIVIDELYADAAAIDAHRAADHYTGFRAAAGDLLASPPDVTVLAEMDVSA
jgi:quinol monooxygenase YgiN